MGVSRYVAKEIMKEIGNRSREFYEFVLPPVDIYEDGTELVVIIDLPGFQKKDIHVNISKDILTLRANRTIDIESYTIHFRQRPNKIEKKIPLPYSIPEDDNVNSKADYANGVVKIRIPISKMTNIPIT
ncbi:MAG: Hsp20/alpha crystallin family protein [Thaumarchaeota archaeon]|jgi:HSP20 family protein|nr:MAG: Hsp20/alpha crystallin family protein [Nitrososphaerota archaeon]